jgi:hypothetical protein
MREVSHRWPSFLPDGSGVLFAIGYDGRTSFDQANIALYTFTTGRRRVVLQGGSFPRVLRDGYLLFTRGHSLLAAPFDLTQHVVHGRAVTVENNVTTVNGWGSAQVEISDEGTLAYVPAVPAANRRLLWVDRAGHEEPLPLQPRVFSRPRVSPDGRRFLVIVRDAVPAIWIYDAPRGVFSPNASLKGDTWFEPLWSPSAVWSPDARTIAYTTDEGAKWKTVEEASRWQRSRRNAAR